MNAGTLRHQVTIQSITSTPDAYGGSVDSWIDVATVWASVEPLQGRELVAAQSVSAETTTKITMRYRSDITAAHRITFEGKFYNLLSLIDPELKHRELIIMASEGLNEG
jgi:SPP1 family predicted phage head-tail adaptor